MRRLIVNADDFGWSGAVTGGIIRAHREGLVTSTTLMANLEGAAEALARARQEAPGLIIGLHLNLTEGRPLAPPGEVAPLLDREGRLMPSLATLYRTIQVSGGARRAAARELEAQVRWALDHGLRPSHLDSHKHVHQVPPLLPLVIDLARRHGIAAVRTTAELALPDIARFLPPGWSAAARVRQGVLVRIARRWGRRARRIVRGSGLATTDWFFGVRATGGISAELLEHLLRRAPEGTGELMVHPGEAEPNPARPTRLAASRPLELAAVCDPRVRLAADAHGWTRATFKDL
ncbi:MAG: ChbG/HpnK family deacetylase [Planctomycetota bacterium]|nr:ChbG/HpnK family deacetylase [Planctomycetota bacterium]